MNLYQNFVNNAKQDFKESFHEEAEEWRERLKMTNDIIVAFMQEEGINEPFLLFTYDEYCQLAERIFNEIIDEQDFRISYSHIYRSEEFIVNVRHHGYDVETAFDKTKQHFATLYFNQILTRIEERTLIEGLKCKCGCNLDNGAEERLRKMFYHETVA